MNRVAGQTVGTLTIADPILAHRVRLLLLDLANDNWPAALRDIDLLYRKVQPAAPSVEWEDQEPLETTALVYSEEDGTLSERICHGPDEEGNCPLGNNGELVACAGKRVAVDGWDLPIARDATRCPLTGLGLFKG
jgi:hypothetical protein